MTGVKSITKKALHHLAGHRLVSIQEAVHMVDDQPLVICSDSMTYVSISQGQVLRNDLETDKRKDIITVYRNRQKQFHDLSLEQYFYRVFSRNTFKQTKCRRGCSHKQRTSYLGPQGYELCTKVSC
jgi:hypothetical protein